jgi:hypothetical protein
MPKMVIRSLSVVLLVIIGMVAIAGVPASADPVCVWVRGHVGSQPFSVPPGASCGPPCSPGVGLSEPGEVTVNEVTVKYWACVNP